MAELSTPVSLIDGPFRSALAGSTKAIPTFITATATMTMTATSLAESLRKGGMVCVVDPVTSNNAAYKLVLPTASQILAAVKTLEANGEDIAAGAQVTLTVRMVAGPTFFDEDQQGWVVTPGTITPAANSWTRSAVNKFDNTTKTFFTTPFAQRVGLTYDSAAFTNTAPGPVNNSSLGVYLNDGTSLVGGLIFHNEVGYVRLVITDVTTAAFTAVPIKLMIAAP